MPIHKVDGGFKWGGRGKVYATREGAARQARAAYANGYVGKRSSVSKSLVDIRKSQVGGKFGRQAFQAITREEGGKRVLNTGVKTRALKHLAYQKKVVAPGASLNKPLYARGTKASANSRSEYEATKAKVKAERKAAWEARQATPKPEGLNPHQQRAAARAERQRIARQPTQSDLIYQQRQEALREPRRVEAAARKKKQAKEAAKLRDKNYARSMDEAYNKVQMTPNQKKTIAAGVGGMALGAGALHQLNKADTQADFQQWKQTREKRREQGKVARDAAIGAGIGTGAAYAGDQALGFAAKKTLARRRRDAMINDPKYRKKYEKHWNKFKQKKGFDTIAGKSGFENSKIMRDYPKKLKDWKGQRAMAWQSSKRGQAITFGGAALTGAAIAARSAQKRRQEQGPVMKAEGAGHGVMLVPFVKALGGSNVREYGYLPENIRNEVGEGSIGIRRNPMSALDLFASSRLMTEAASRAKGERVSRRRLTRRAHNEMQFAGTRAMLYSPVGRGSVF